MRKMLLVTIAVAALLALGAAQAADMHDVHAMNGMHTTKAFAGVKVNGGTVTHSNMDGRIVLTLSDDFKVPDAPAPHWQVVDSKGNTYLLQRLVVKGDKFNKSITLPPYIHDVAKVQIWCAWAEALLGETSFDTPLM